MKKLVVTADDFGASEEVNVAVQRAHREGILTAASLMVTGNATDDAVGRACETPTLAVGLHLVLVEGRPRLFPEALPDLVDQMTGRFRTDMVRAAVRIFASPSARRQLYAEVEAQFQAFADTGLPLDHVNAHKHFHLHPTIAATVLRVGRRFGMQTVRAPIEPGTSGVESWWARRLQSRLRREGMLVPDQVIGLRWSGQFTPERMRAALGSLPDGLTEVYTHPATGPYPGSAPGYDYAGELAALLDPLAAAAIRDQGASHGPFRQFLATR